MISHERSHSAHDTSISRSLSICMIGRYCCTPKDQLWALIRVRPYTGVTYNNSSNGPGQDSYRLGWAVSSTSPVAGALSELNTTTCGIATHSRQPCPLLLVSSPRFINISRDKPRTNTHNTQQRTVGLRGHWLISNLLLPRRNLLRYPKL